MRDRCSVVFCFWLIKRSLTRRLEDKPSFENGETVLNEPIRNCDYLNYLTSKENQLFEKNCIR